MKDDLTHGAPAFGELTDDALMAELCEMEADVSVLETKEVGARRPAANGNDSLKQAVVAIGKEVLKLQDQAASSKARAHQPQRLSRASDPASLKGLHERKHRSWSVYQEILARRDREAKSRRGVDPLTMDRLHRGDTVLDRIGAMEKRLAYAEVKGNRPPGLASRWGGGGPLQRSQGAKALYKQAIHHWMRTGDENFKGEPLRQIAKKALNTELNPDGGYVVLSERESSPLDASLLELSAMRQRATIQTISTNELVRPINKRGADAGWVAERGSRPETESPVLAQDRFPVMELYAQPAATQTLLDDAAIDVEAWLAQEVVDAFALQESPAFMTGTGGTQPRGLLSYEFVTDHDLWDHGKFRLVESGASGGFPPFDAGPPATGPDNVLLDIQYALKAGHRQNSSWLMNRSTVSVIRKFKDANGLPLWQPSVQVGQPATLLGFTIDEDEYMPDIGASTIPIGFGDWKKTYLIVDRIGVRVLRDPFTQKPFILFYTTKRVGGGVQYFDAAIFLRIDA